MKREDGVAKGWVAGEYAYGVVGDGSGGWKVSCVKAREDNNEGRRRNVDVVGMELLLKLLAIEDLG